MSRNDDLEELRWNLQPTSYTSVEEWTAQRGPGTHWNDEWFKEGTRNHGVDGSGNICREVRDDAPYIRIDDVHMRHLTPLVVGRSIIKIEREPSPPTRQWDDGQNTVTITLDDGAVLTFTGWGYDASGCNTTYTPGDVS